MQGLIEEAQETIEGMEPGPLRDVALVAAARQVEHYEIAAYGSLCALLGAAGHRQVCDLLARTLEEEKAADARLSQLAEREINPEALRWDRAANDPGRRGTRSAA
jgi:ferritin-like metal-binding protein YciE